MDDESRNLKERCGADLTECAVCKVWNRQVKEFPDGLHLTLENYWKALENGMDMDCFARHLFPEDLAKEFFTYSNAIWEQGEKASHELYKLRWLALSAILGEILREYLEKQEAKEDQ